MKRKIYKASYKYERTFPDSICGTVGKIISCLDGLTTYVSPTIQWWWWWATKHFIKQVKEAEGEAELREDER